MIRWTWKYADWLMIVIAVVVGLFGIFLPSNEKQLNELKRVTAERKAAWADYHARVAKATAEHEALTAKQREDYGIVYVPVIAAPAAEPPKPAPKPQQ
jgi:hypothetical protein